MDDSLGSKARRIPSGIGDIVAVRQENVAEAASLFEPVGQVFDKARRIDEPVARAMLKKVAVTAERFARIEAAINNPGASGNGNSLTAAATPDLSAVPIDAVGQATNAR